eukprot:m.7639 g.7639  ORF g.7639 m.7639 type:complete len:280 (+) comp2210_c0_seq2:82-921(+)
MADPHQAKGNVTLQIHRMITQLQTQLGAVSMHCGEINKLCQDRADPKRVEMKVKVVKQEEQEICALLKDLLALKSKLRPIDQQHLDASIRPLSDEYNAVVQKFHRACILGHDYCVQVQSMLASHLSTSDEPKVIALGAGLGTAVLLEEDATDDGESAALERDVGQLSEMFALLLEHATDQGRRIDTLEAHMEAAEAEAHNGALKMTQAAKLSAAVVPFTAAVLGGALLGPLGMLAGLKGASAVTAAVGASAGYLTGSWYKRRVQKSAEAAQALLTDKSK